MIHHVFPTMLAKAGCMDMAGHTGHAGHLSNHRPGAEKCGDVMMHGIFITKNICSYIIYQLTLKKKANILLCPFNIDIWYHPCSSILWFHIRRCYKSASFHHLSVQVASRRGPYCVPADFFFMKQPSPGSSSFTCKEHIFGKKTGWTNRCILFCFIVLLLIYLVFILLNLQRFQKIAYCLKHLETVTSCTGLRCPWASITTCPGSGCELLNSLMCRKFFILKCFKTQLEIEFIEFPILKSKRQHAIAYSWSELLTTPEIEELCALTAMAGRLKHWCLGIHSSKLFKILKPETTCPSTHGLAPVGSEGIARHRAWVKASGQIFTLQMSWGTPSVNALWFAVLYFAAWIFVMVFAPLTLAILRLFPFQDRPMCWYLY